MRTERQKIADKKYYARHRAQRLEWQKNYYHGRKNRNGKSSMEDVPKSSLDAQGWQESRSLEGSSTLTRNLLESQINGHSVDSDVRLCVEPLLRETHAHYDSEKHSYLIDIVADSKLKSLPWLGKTRRQVAVKTGKLVDL